MLGGSGSRFKSTQSEPVPKQFYSLPIEQVKQLLMPNALDDSNESLKSVPSLPIFEITSRQLLSSLEISNLIIVAPVDYLNNDALLLPITRLRKDYPDITFEIVEGGANRHLSFISGIKKCIQANAKLALVHDANRMQISESFIVSIAQALNDLASKEPSNKVGGCIPVIDQVDSTCLITKTGNIEYLDRNKLKRIQTPQIVRVEIIQSILNSTEYHPQEYSDEGSFLTSYGYNVNTYTGDINNVKITYRNDLS